MKQTPTDDDKWTTCCSGTTEKSFVKYLVQVLMGATIIIFSMVQIFRDTGDGKEIYFSLLSGTLGVFWPHPQIGTSSRGQDTLSPLASHPPGQPVSFTAVSQ